MDSSLVKAVGFVHLRVHSAFSLRQGALSIEALAKLAKADSMPALAITDTNNLFGALEFSEKLAKAGVQPIIGAQITVDFGDAPPSASRLAEARLAQDSAYLLDCTKARTTLGWAPALKVEDAISETIDWVRKNLDRVRKLPAEYIHKE